ncbi:pyridoxal-dependent decarboxylase [Pelagibius sp. Alg239-R121]|uniref:pyridoxal phosphate-dependent decarboxylase family protein n=1 Tax=Pelagibius sp. Alg239-R121 TaxID=2993448 RepID=UPI0024A6AA9E|nr:pyridoxal-dependent decarboxylase [Pelagibius sp. Alg239-R121]
MTCPATGADSPERSLDPEDWTEFRKLSHAMLDQALDHMEAATERPVWTPVPDEAKQALVEPVPMEGQGTAQVCEDLTKHVLPYATGNTHPRFFGWVHGAGTPGGVIADTMASAMNSNLGGRDHGAVYVERQVVDWCRRLFDFPETASGLVVSGTSIATLIALTTARYQKVDYDVRRRGVQPSEGKLVGYASAEAHSCMARTFDLMGLGMDALRTVPVDEAYSMDINALRAAIETDLAAGKMPFCVMGSPATVNTGAIDDLDAIADVCKEYDLWFHVDGAFGAVAALSENLRPRMKGIERADSIAFDFHKWMHVQYDAGFVLIRSEEAHREAFTLRREYLTASPRGLAAGNPWFCEYGPELSRGFRALKVWFALKEHGIKRIAEKVDDNCRQAAYLGELVQAHPDLELSAPVSLNICCFRFVAPDMTTEALNKLNSEIVMDLQESGVAAPSTTKLGEVNSIRVNITNHRTTTADMDLLVNAVAGLGRKAVEV